MRKWECGVLRITTDQNGRARLLSWHPMSDEPPRLLARREDYAGRPSEAQEAAWDAAENDRLRSERRSAMGTLGSDGWEIFQIDREDSWFRRSDSDL